MKNKLLWFIAAFVVLGSFLQSCKKDDPDKDAPEIMLVEPTWVTLRLNDTYEEPGYTAYDERDGDITDQVVVVPIDENQEGIQYVRYSVSDKAGNIDSTRRTVQVYNQAGFFAGELFGESVDPYPGTKEVKYEDVGIPSSTVNQLITFQNFAGVADANIDCYVYSEPGKAGEVAFASDSPTLDGSAIEMIKGEWSGNTIVIHFSKADGSETMVRLKK